MPELPEVETIRRGIAPVVGRRIARVVVRENRLRWPVPRDLSRRVAGRRVTSAERRAKYLLLGLDSGDRLIIHLGMSGRLFLLPPGHTLVKHDHVDIEFDRADGDAALMLRLHDPRRFGSVLLWPAKLDAHPLFAALGPEPLSAEFSGEYLFGLSRRRSAPAKNFLMDARVVVGAGNIYATEALFRAGVRPTRAAGRLSRSDCDRLVEKIREVLNEAIEQGGTTLRDFRGSGGELGNFQLRLFVYDREGQACRRCDGRIRRIVLGGRSSYYCPNCQK